MSWLRLTLTDNSHVDFNFRWVVSVRRAPNDTATEIRVSAAGSFNDNLCYTVVERPEQIWDAWVERLRLVPPTCCGDLVSEESAPPRRLGQRKDGGVSRTTRKKPKKTS